MSVPGQNGQTASQAPEGARLDVSPRGEETVDPQAQLAEQHEQATGQVSREGLSQRAALGEGIGDNPEAVLEELDAIPDTPTDEPTQDTDAEPDQASQDAPEEDADGADGADDATPETPSAGETPKENFFSTVSKIWVQIQEFFKGGISKVLDWLKQLGFNKEVDEENLSGEEVEEVEAAAEQVIDRSQDRVGPGIEGLENLSARQQMIALARQAVSNKDMLSDTMPKVNGAPNYNCWNWTVALMNRLSLSHSTTYKNHLYRNAKHYQENYSKEQAQALAGGPEFAFDQWDLMRPGCHVVFHNGNGADFFSDHSGILLSFDPVTKTGEVAGLPRGSQSAPNIQTIDFTKMPVHWIREPIPGGDGALVG